MLDEKDSKWQCYIIPDLATWTGAAGSKPYTPIEFYGTYEQAAARFQELRSEPYNSEEVPGARLTFGVQREDPPSAADLLHVRQGKNYLVDDYTRMASLNQSPEVMDILRQMRKDLGFDRVRVYEHGAMEENGNYTYLSIIFGSKSLSELMANLDMIGEIMEADKRIYDQYTAAREDAEVIKAEYEETLGQLADKQEEYEAEKADLEAKIAEASELIAQLEEEISSNYDLYLQVLAEEEALESDIQSMIAELERQEAANSITSTGTYIWPLPGYSPGSAYGWRMHPIFNEMRFHAGEDIGAPSGTPILAADSGVATVIPDNGNGYGNYIMINHGGGRVTLYAHMSSFAISGGASVSQGQVIGYVGSTGNSTGPHLHFEVRVNGATTDPKQYFNFG